MSFGILNSFWGFPLFRLGGYPSSPPLREKKNDTYIGPPSSPSLRERGNRLVWKGKFKDKEYEIYPDLVQESQFKW